MDCQICCEKYTTKIRKKFSCYSCNNTFCSKCIIANIKNNIKSKSIFGPYGLTKIMCLFCNSPLSPQELRDLLSKKNNKIIIKEELAELFNEECNLLTDTENTIKEQRLIHEINTIKKWMTQDGFNEKQINNTLQEMGYLDERIVQPERHCPDCRTLLITAPAPLMAKNNEVDKTLESALDPWNRGSPVYDYKCVNCNFYLCSKCLSIKNDDHLCDSKALETIKKVNETCHNCPNCKLLIEKEEGSCDQMFCTECHTTFSWATGKVAATNHVKHNPHFFEWMRQNNIEERHPNDNPCEGNFLIKCEKLEHGNFMKFINTVLQKSIENIDEIYERDEFIREQFRINFLTKKLTLLQWKKKFIQHINTQRYNKESQVILKLCLDSLYYIILLENGNEKMIQSLFNIIYENHKQIQNNYGRIIHYILLPIDEEE